MKEFKIKMEWIEKHEGFIAVKANSKEEALGILESEKRKYTSISKNCYHNSSSISIENITIEHEFPIAERIKDIEFCTVWDGGDVYSSPAKLNLNTGEVFDIEPVSDDIAQSVTTYEGSYILVDSIKQSVYRIKDTDRYVTAKFITDLLAEGVAVYGNEHIELHFDEEDDDSMICIWVCYHSTSTSFDYGNITFVNERNSYDELIGFCEKNDFYFFDEN